MMSFLSDLKNTIEKKKRVLHENFDLTQYFVDQKPKVSTEPFSHIVVDNFFKDGFAKKIEDYFLSIRERGFGAREDISRLHPFRNEKGVYEYDGYLYVPKQREHEIFKLFYSVAWNSYFSNIFAQPTNLVTSLAVHHHEPGDSTGFVHHDYSEQKFCKDDTLENGVLANDQAREFERKCNLGMSHDFRIVSLIYYFGSNWKNGDGGETGVYASKTSEPTKIVAPVRNRLFAFQISPKSFHAFQTNKKPRSSIVQWFHIDTAWCVKKYGMLPKDIKS